MAGFFASGRHGVPGASLPDIRVHGTYDEKGRIADLVLDIYDIRSLPDSKKTQGLQYAGLVKSFAFYQSAHNTRNSFYVHLSGNKGGE